MEREEFAKISLYLRSCYPKEKFLETSQQEAIWHDNLSDLDYEILKATVKKWVQTEKWSPTISDLREKYYENQLATGIFKDYSQAWEEVIKAIQKFGSNRADEALASLDKITETAARRVGFTNICRSTNLSVERAFFRDVYVNLMKQQVEHLKVSQSTMQKFATGISEHNQNLLSMGE